MEEVDTSVGSSFRWWDGSESLGWRVSFPSADDSTWFYESIYVYLILDTQINPKEFIIRPDKSVRTIHTHHSYSALVEALRNLRPHTSGYYEPEPHP